MISICAVAHMSGQTWVGLSDTAMEGTFVFTDGTPAVSDKNVSQTTDIYYQLECHQ